MACRLGSVRMPGSLFDHSLILTVMTALFSKTHRYSSIYIRRCMMTNWISRPDLSGKGRR